MKKLVVIVAILFCSCIYTVYLKSENVDLPRRVGYKIISVDTLIDTQSYYQIDLSQVCKRSDTTYKIKFSTCPSNGSILRWFKK
jgi:hypothetical protein